MVVEHPDGTLFVRGYGASVPTLWKSSDHGANWMRVNVGNESDGALGNSDVDLAVAPDGTLYFVAMVFDREALEGRSISIGVSKDVGMTWAWTFALYSLWINQEGLWLARSRDQGVNWTSWHMDKGADVLYYPYLIARGHGELAGTWFSGVGEKLQAHVGRFEVGDGGAPRMIQSRPIRLNAWWQDVRIPAGEYLAVTFLRTGGLAMVSPIQNQRAEQFGFSWWRIEVLALAFQTTKASEPFRIHWTFDGSGRIVDFARAEDARFSIEGGGEDRLPPRRIVLVSPPPALPRGRQARR